MRCGKDTESKNLKVVKTKSGQSITPSKRAICDSKKLRYIKEQKLIYY